MRTSHKLAQRDESVSQQQRRSSFHHRGWSFRASLVGSVLLLSTLFAPLAGADTTTIYLLNAQGNLVNMTAYCTYQTGSVYMIATGALVGTVNPETDLILNANGQEVGEITQSSD